MLQPLQQKDTVHFGHWHFNTQLGELKSNEKTIRLEPQVAKVLSYFYSKQDVLITKDELIRELWENRVVTDDAIARCISSIRQILSPADRNAIIKTISRRGYIATFPQPDINSATAQGKPPAKYASKTLLLTACLIVVLALILMLIPAQLSSKNQRPKAPPLIAILPFSSDTLNAEDQFLSTGLHSELLTQLSNIRSIRIVSNTAIQAYVNANEDYKNAGKDLQVDYVLTGHIQVADEVARTRVSLNQVSTHQQIWSDTYESDVTTQGIFQFYGGLAKAIAAEINIEMSSAEYKQISLTPTENMAAYRAYRKAIDKHESRQLSSNSPVLFEALEEAVNLDPGFTRAWSEIASYASLRSFRNNEPYYTKKAEDAIDILYRLSPHSVDYYYAKAAYLYYVVKDYEMAYSIIKLAVASHPNYTRALLMQSYIERRLGLTSMRVKTLETVYRLEPRDVVAATTYFFALRADDQLERLTDELDAYKGQTHESIEKLKHILAFKQHRQLDRLLNATQKSCTISKNASCAWEALIALRQYDQALIDLSNVDLAIDTALYGVNEINLLFTYLLSGENLDYSQYSAQWRAFVDDNENTQHINRDLSEIISKALILAMFGENKRAKEQLLRHFAYAPVDLADRYAGHIPACRILAMVGAYDEVLPCLREAIEHSFVGLKFLEHKMPFYDGIRDTPEFVSWVQEIDPN